MHPTREFREIFGASPTHLVQAPGRINLIGEHVDYNDGLAIPCGIDRYARMLSRPREDRRARIHSTLFSQTVSISVSEPLQQNGFEGWALYPAGVIREFQKRELPLCGMDCFIYGDVPAGAGLSSSAALEVAFAESCRIHSRLELSGLELATLCQQAERLFVGVRCGIMDQYAAVFSEKGSALLLDCRSRRHEGIPLPSGISFVAVDSGVSRSLAGSGYNRRRRECEEALYLVNDRIRGLSSLRDLTYEKLSEYAGILPIELLKRARHVVTEIERARLFSKALMEADVGALGPLLYESHRSLRDDFEVSVPELDFLVDEASSHEAVLGGRLMGAGFGGSSIHLVKSEGQEDFAEFITSRYAHAFAKRAEARFLNSTDGVKSVDL